jgi:protein-S-isoprenylcysteine O-methyltransferase Ste14
MLTSIILVMKKSNDIPPTYFYLCIAIIVISYLGFPGMQIIGFPENLPGFAVTALGVALTAWTWKLFLKHNTPDSFAPPKYLVREGPFRFSRNPMYLGMGILLLGLAVASGNLISFISPAVFFIVMHVRFIPFEEKRMEKTFGRKYLDYKKKVRRWL